MSWDIYIQDLPEVARVEDIPDDFRPGPIGQRDELMQRLRTLLPEADFDDGLWGFVRTPTADLSIGVTAEEGLVSHIVVHVHGGADSPAWVAKLVRGLGTRALDTSTGDFFDPERPDAGFRAWLSFKEGLEHKDR